jgi:hypothetical protein
MTCLFFLWKKDVAHFVQELNITQTHPAAKQAMERFLAEHTPR